MIEAEAPLNGTYYEAANGLGIWTASKAPLKIEDGKLWAGGVVNNLFTLPAAALEDLIKQLKHEHQANGLLTWLQ